MHQSNMHIKPHRLHYTRHAQARMQQRAINGAMVQMLFALGAEQEQKGGTSRLFIPKRRRKQVRKNLESLLKRFDSLQNSYVVLSDDGSVITTCHENN